MTGPAGPTGALGPTGPSGAVSGSLAGDAVGPVGANQVVQITGNTGGVVPVTSPLALGNNPAASGIVQIPSNTQIKGRNAANSADIQLLRLDNSDNVQISGDGSAHNTIIDAANQVEIGPNGAVTTFISARTSITIQPGQGGVPPSYVGIFDSLKARVIASSGLLRFNNTPSIVARNNAGSADLPMMATDASDHLLIGGATGPAGILMDASGAITIGSGGNVTQFTVIATGPISLEPGTDGVAADTGVTITAGSSGVPYLALVGAPGPTAATGVIRLPNATSITARNVNNKGDLSLIASDGSNNINVGGGTGNINTVNIGTSTSNPGIVLGTAAGSVTIPVLAGTGTRAVQATSTGVLIAP